ncbi:EamA family transporter [Puteibacter caeruleilacunae]|nr:EamA family transporter [Puteibacter caeruleilacunae]
MWILWGILSASLLGFYDIFKKLSVNNNNVILVLLFSCLTGTLISVVDIAGSIINPQFMIDANIYAPTISGHEHLLILLKSFIVVIGWIFAFVALKHLPITIVTPIRATGPLWTLLGAILLFSEQLNGFQYLGISITLAFFFLFSTAGKHEGINFRSNKWIYFIILATLLGAVSGLYDKFIIRKIDRVAVQVWFSIYQIVILLPFAIHQWYKKNRTPFEWRWWIPCIGLFLILADYFYFYSLSYADSMISILSSLRRGGIVIAFTFGAIVFKEKNITRKALYLLGILSGILIIVLSSHAE